MDARQFEALSRRVALLVGRRPLLRAALVAPLAAGSVLVEEGEAKRKRRKKCKPPRIKCGKKCLASSACCTNANCASVTGQVCVANACECPGGQVASGGECAKPCNPACGECQRCDDGTCVNVVDDTPCSNDGACQAGVCKPDRSFGCASTQNACVATSGVSCPDSTTSDAKCFVDGAGDPVCGTGLCTNLTTDEACESELGEGAFVLPCALCGIGGNARVCVKPVKQ